MANDFGAFYRYWGDWESRLNLPIKRNGGKLLFPSLHGKPQANGTTEFLLSHPICIYNAPPKASTQRRGARHRNTILIEGGFHLRGGGTAPHLIQGHCSLSLFQTETLDRGLKLDQLDAMHFDMEQADAQKAYHPMFHVQRDTSNKLDDKAVRETVAKVAHVDQANITVDRSRSLGTQYLRLPTPQMDVFAVLTALIADFFSNPGDADAKVRAQFKAILTLLTDPKNVVREGMAAQVLGGRANGAYSCPAHWYSEIA